MKHYRLEKGGLVLGSSADAAPGAHEVLVRVRASSLNYRDLMIFEGRYPWPAREGVVPLSDGAGEVAAVGAKVTRFRVGDRVAGIFFPNWLGGPMTFMALATQLGSEHDGWLSEFKLVSEEALVPISDHLTFEEAATLPCAAVTAWKALTAGRPLVAGDSVLAMGSGGVSLFTLQIAKLFGARVIATTSSEEKAERLKKLGADEVINYRTSPDWHLRVRELTGGGGVDHVVEVGGAGTLPQSIQSAALEGEVVLIGALASSKAGPDLSPLAASFITLRRMTVGSRSDFEAMNKTIGVHQMRPVIDKVFSFDQAPEAMRYFAGGAHIGKVVIRHD